jgi:hypothetical protein
MWQTKFYTLHELTCICRALAAASSSSLDSVFGSIQLHTAVIDTLPEEGIKINVYCTSLTVDKRKILLNLRNRRFLPNSFLLFLFSCFHFLGLNTASSFSHSDVFYSTNYSLSHLPMPLYMVYVYVRRRANIFLSIHCYWWLQKYRIGVKYEQQRDGVVQKCGYGY